MNKKTCYLDGNALCIVGKDFINIQESRCMFVDLNEKQLKEFNDLDKKISKNLQNLTPEEIELLEKYGLSAQQTDTGGQSALSFGLLK